MQREMADHRAAVGQRLKTLRKSRRLSQEDAAHKAGVSLTTWRNWERGLRSPYERNWRKLTDGFELTEEEIASVRGTPPEPLGLGNGNGKDPAIAELAAAINQLGDQVAEILRRLPPEDEPQPPRT